PTTIRATVVLPEPDSPTSANVSPRLISKVTPSTAFKNSRWPPSSTRLSHGFETSNARRRFLTSTKDAGVMRHFPLPARHRDGTPRPASRAGAIPAARRGSGRTRTRSADGTSSPAGSPTAAASSPESGPAAYLHRPAP